MARQAADVDLFPGARLRLGVGIGWNHVEYEALGQDFHTRGARQEEQIELLRHLFTGPVIDLLGLLRPSLLGGTRAQAFGPDSDLARRIERKGIRSRVARLAGGFIFFGGGVENAIGGPRTGLRLRVARLGKPVDASGGDYVALSGGDVGELTREAEAWRNAGGTHFSVVTMGLGLNFVEAHIDYISSISDRLGVR